jgi:hypothetical protein
MSRTDENILKFRNGEPQNLWEEFGLLPPQYEDERHAPPVDRRALQALVDRKLSREEVRKLYRLTLRFQSWAEALAELDAESLRKDLRDPEGSWG